MDRVALIVLVACAVIAGVLPRRRPAPRPHGDPARVLEVDLADRTTRDP